MQTMKGEVRDMEREEGDEGKDVGEEDVEGRRVLRGGGMGGVGKGEGDEGRDVGRDVGREEGVEGEGC